MNANENNLALTAVRLGLLCIASEGQPFPGRNGGPPGEAIFDSRGAPAAPLLRTVVLGALMVELARFPEDAVIAGLRSSGLVFGAQLAAFSSRPFVTVWPDSNRQSGLQRAVEGDVSGKPVVLFDNALATGDSLRLAAARVTESGGKVAGALMIGAYREPPAFSFPVIRLFTISQLLHAAQELGQISQARLEQLLKNTNS